MALEQHPAQQHASGGADLADDHHEHDHGAGGHSTCGNCVHCCASLAMVSTPLRVSFPPAAPPAVTVPSESSGHPQDPLDRPPLALQSLS